MQRVIKKNKILSVDRLVNCTREQFQHYFDTQTPCIIEKQREYFVSKWPLFKAFEKSATAQQFTATSLYTKYGDCMVPVEQGNNYATPNSIKFYVPLRFYIDAILNMEAEGNVNEAHLLYLAQHEIFNQLPDLEKEIDVPEYCKSGKGELYLSNIWLGPGGTRTTLHFDYYHSIFCQLVGSKQVKLIDPRSVSEKSLYPYEKMQFSNTSQVDVENIDHERFPHFADCPMYECHVDSTDILFIPRKYWHSVKSDTSSLSVNFWFL